MWWNGPSFLHGADFNAPVADISLPVGDEDVECERKKVDEAVLICSDDSQLFPVDRWSHLGKAYRAIAWAMRFISCIKVGATCSGGLSADEYTQAKCVFLRFLQMSSC